jgi:hypothetical protein
VVTIQKGCLRKPGERADLPRSAARHDRDPPLACEEWRDSCECGKGSVSLPGCATLPKPFGGLSTGVNRVRPDCCQRAPRNREERPEHTVCTLVSDARVCAQQTACGIASWVSPPPLQGAAGQEGDWLATPL